MEEPPVSIRVFPGELRPVYYTTVLGFRSTNTTDIIRLSLEKLQIFEDKSLYELFKGRVDDPREEWTLLTDEDCPVAIQEQWRLEQQVGGGGTGGGGGGGGEMRLYLERKQHASLVLADFVSQHISPELDEGKIEDMCHLEELSESTMLANLRVRFSHKHIYSYVGSILISVNPYYYYSIYNPKYTTMYQGKAFNEAPPHIFAIADNAYNSMLNDRRNQSVIISGESGAGKTESTKFLLHHLMSLSAKLDESQSLELITLGTGPVLEAFGNARTVANDNSSRFGKFILVKFKENGAYYGASIEKYLLEKSRIISQAPEERNYHVFYYLLVGADAALRSQLKLLQPHQYCYLAQELEDFSLAPPNGAEEYHRLKQSLSMLMFSTTTQMRMFTVLSAILHIGNIQFRRRESEEILQIENMDTIAIISSLLQVEESTLRLALTTRKSRPGGTDFFVTPYRLEEAIATRDSLAKALYGALFDWIVDQVNYSLASNEPRGSHKGHSIGVLDIFGFEVFQVNSFEQFCINYANEQLQQYFNKHIFKLEQAEYEAEGIEWSSVTFIDNQECLDLIAKKPTGLLPLLDEECSFPGANDSTLFQKFERQHKTHPNYRSPQMKLKEPQFTVLHYASAVTYSVTGFREKNRDLMRQDIVQVLRSSHMDLVRALIGLPTYAVHRWHMAFLKLSASFAFRRAGRDYRAKLDGHLTSSLPFHFIHASSPALTLNEPDGTKLADRSRNFSEGFSSKLIVTDKPSEESFPLEHGRLRVGHGLRASRSYDLLSKATASGEGGEEEGGGGREREVKRLCSAEEQQKKEYDLSMQVKAQSMPYGISPRFSRKFPAANSTGNLRDSSSSASRMFSVKSPPKKSPQLFSSSPFARPKPRNLSSSSSSSTPPHSPVSEHQSTDSVDGRRGGGGGGGVVSPKEVTSPPLPPPPPPAAVQREESRSRLPSLSGIQERLRKHLPRALRSRGGAEGERGRRNSKHSRPRSAPRIRGPGAVTDPRLLSSFARASSSRHRGPSKTVSAQFQVSLVSLMERLEKTNPFFVRCLKSNNLKAPCQFDDDLVIRQLRYTGMVETVKIRKSGYSVRTSLEEFYEKHQFLIGPRSPDLASQVDSFLAGLGFGTEDYQIGTTKVFMRDKHKQALQKELGDKVLARIVVIQRWVRAKMMKCRFLHMRRCAIIIQTMVRGWQARRKVDTLRKRVCNAVLVQAAWRGYVGRKTFILLKQAAIILQAHWRGRTARQSYVVLLEEKWRRQAEEAEKQRLEEQAQREREEEQARREREEEEERREALRLEQEEQERLRQLEEQAREEERKLEELKLQEERLVLTRVEELLLLSVEQKRESTGSFLDEEVTDVLFQFDSMVTQLEIDTIRARSLSASPLIRDEDVASQQSELVISQNSELTNSFESGKLSSKDFSGSSVEEPQQSLTETDAPLENGILDSEETIAALPESQPRVLVKPMVRNLKQRFQSPSPESMPRSSSPLKEEDFPKPAGNVKHLIAQMLMARSHSPDEAITSSASSSFSSTADEKRQPLVSSGEETAPSGHVKVLIAQMLAPRTPSPKDSSSSALQTTTDDSKRQSQAIIHGKIAELFDDQATERREPRTYTPPLFRRKIQSPFLVRAKSHDEESRSSPPRPRSACSDRNTRIKPLQHRLSVPFLLEVDKTPFSEETEVEYEATALGNDAAATYTKDTLETGQGRVEQLSPFEVAELSTSPVFPAAAREEVPAALLPDHDDSTAIESTPAISEDTLIPDSQMAADSTDPQMTNSLSSPKKESAATLKEDSEDCPVHHSPKTEKKTSKKSPKRHHQHHRSEHKSVHGEVLEVSAAQAQHDIRGNSLFSPPIVDEPETIQLGDDEITLTPKRDRTSSMPRASSKRKVSDIIELNSIEISVRETKEKAAKARLSVHESPNRKKSSDYDMLLPLPGKKSEYDHLLPLPPKKVTYDHLSPLQPQEELGTFRQRSSSDVISHRVMLPFRDTEEDDILCGSEVVTREKPPGDFNSLTRRKKVISLADPRALTRSSLDESSEFTRCLTPEEIVHLNKHRHMPPSPTDRLRLFSFTKRRLKLPFRSGRRKEKERERERYLASPDVDHASSPSTPLSRRKRMTPPSLNITSHEGSKRHSKFPSGVAEQLLAHNLKSVSASKLSSCEVCHKAFTGFMRQALKCVDCEVMLHRHCEERAPHCKAKIESGSYVTMSRKKVVQKLADLDDLGQFLLEKIGVLSKSSSTTSVIDKVFRLSLHEFHVALISRYSLSIQSSTELPKDKDKATELQKTEEADISITFAQLVSRFSNIFTGIAKREGLTDPCVLSIGTNQIKSFLDEFCKSRRTKRPSNINPSALKRRTPSGREIQPKVHKGHRFVPQQIKVHTVCELCSKQILLLANGEVCEVCGYICHDTCLKKTSKKCEGRGRSKSIQEAAKPSPVKSKSNFGVPLHELLPPDTVKVPVFIETCLQYIEQKGLYTQGIYRKSAGSSSKKAVRSALDEDPVHADLERFSVHAVASAVGACIRELPEPLLTRELYMEFLRAMDLSSKKERLHTLHQLIQRMPEVNHCVFERLIFHLARVAQHEHINKMGPNNLAIIFAPCLLQGKKNRRPEELLKDIRKQTECIETIITEQMEKLTATLRGIRTLTSCATRLNELIDQFQEPQSPESPAPKLPPTPPAVESSSVAVQPTTTAAAVAVPPMASKRLSGLSDEERRRLAHELAQIERERVELTVNLPKLEPFLSDSDEPGDSEPSTLSPSPSPSSPFTLPHPHREFSPIHEAASEQNHPGLSWQVGGRSAAGMRGGEKPTSPTIRINDVDDQEDALPDLPSSPTLIPITKNRVSMKLPRRPPSARHRRSAAAAARSLSDPSESAN